MFHKKLLIGFIRYGLFSYDNYFGNEEPEPNGFIYKFAIDQNEQKKGYGTMFMQFALEELKKNRCKDVTLSVHEKNTVARALYEKLGFEEIEKNNDQCVMIKIIK